MGLLDTFKKRGTKAIPTSLKIPVTANQLYAPASGQTEPMESLPDPVFASGGMGYALGVWPDEGTAYAPISGTVTFAMPHAFGIANGELEVLVHVGVDTVEMQGDGFCMHVEKGQEIEAGDVLVAFDRKMVASAGYSDVIITIVTNTRDLAERGVSVVPCTQGRISAGECMLHLTS